jgi:hypothetical protein
LEAENERLKSSLGAHGTLRLIYSNPNSSEGNRIKAAAASLPFETPKLMPEKAPLDLTAEKPIEPLQDRVVRLMAREDRILSLSLEQRAALIPGVSGRNGNGTDDGSDGQDDDTGS